MSQQPVHISLPDHLYERIRQMAERNHRPMETLIAESLSMMYGGDIPAEPEIIATFTDKQLWMLVHQQLEPEQRARFHDLLEKNQAAPLVGSEREELRDLQAELDQQTALRVEALAALQSRGHDIQSYLNSHLA